jgi:hypothetical protein
MLWYGDGNFRTPASLNNGGEFNVLRVVKCTNVHYNDITRNVYYNDVTRNVYYNDITKNGTTICDSIILGVTFQKSENICKYCGYIY